jgi:hypothetical protein
LSIYFCKFPPGNPKNRTSASLSAFPLDTAAPNADGLRIIDPVHFVETLEREYAS